MSKNIENLETRELVKQSSYHKSWREISGVLTLFSLGGAIAVGAGELVNSQVELFDGRGKLPFCWYAGTTALTAWRTQANHRGLRQVTAELATRNPLEVQAYTAELTGSPTPETKLYLEAVAEVDALSAAALQPQRILPQEVAEESLA